MSMLKERVPKPYKRLSSAKPESKEDDKTFITGPDEEGRIAVFNLDAKGKPVNIIYGQPGDTEETLE